MSEVINKVNLYRLTPYNTITSLKYHFWPFFTSFSPYFGSTTNILYNKKTQKPLCLLRFKNLTFFSIKTDNTLILYRSISLISAPFFAMTEESKLTMAGGLQAPCQSIDS